MEYSYVVDDDDALVALLGKHFGSESDPLDVQIAIMEDEDWAKLRPELLAVGNRLLRLELDDGDPDSPGVALIETPMWGARNRQLDRPSAEELTLWRRVLDHVDLPVGLEVVVRDLLLTTRGDGSPANADRVIDLYRSIAHAGGDGLHVALALLRANTIARSRSMQVEASLRAEILALAERALSSDVPPGIALRHVGAVVAAPRRGARAPDELSRLAVVLDHLERQYGDDSSADVIATYRLAIADTEADRDIARRRHVERYLAISQRDTVAFRAMIWAEKAVELASSYGLQDLRDAAVVRMQRLSRTDLGWSRTTQEFKLPMAVVRQEEREAAKLSGWEQGLALFLASDSPSGDDEANRRMAARRRRGFLDLITRRTFGSHQLPERTGASPDEEQLARIVQMNLWSSAIVLKTRLVSIAVRFGVPEEASIIAFVSAAYGSSPSIVRPFAQALRLFWSSDPSGAARLAIPLIEAAARELLMLLDAPLYRTERGQSPGRFPAMDFYVDKLEGAGLDPDWVAALRGALLSRGLNLRNRFAHGFQLDFSDADAALLIRLAGLFIAMPVGIAAIDDERARTPLRAARAKLRRRLGWVWR